jgi:hypothetical protein
VIPASSQRGLGPQAPVSLDSYSHYRNSSPSRRPATRGRHCGKWTMHGTSPSGDHKFLRHMCKGYRCAACGPKKRRKLRARLVTLATQAKLDKMLTLTVDPARIPVGEDPITFVRNKVWRDMRTYLKRFLAQRIVYIAILETHQSGIGHLHVLVSRYLPHAVVKRFSIALGGGEIVDIRHVGVRNVGAYLSKYLSKESDLPSGVRHVTTSRGLTIWPEAHREKNVAIPETSWQLLRLPIELYYANSSSPKNESYNTEQDGARTLQFFVANGLGSDVCSPVDSVCSAT